MGETGKTQRAVTLKEPFFPYGPQSDAHFEERLKRLMHALEVDSGSELSKALGIKHQAVSAARKRRQVPFNWMLHVSEAKGISLDWLLYGQGEIRLPGDGPLCPPPTLVSLDGYSRPLRDTPQGREPFGEGYATGPVYEAGQIVLLQRVRPRLLPGTTIFERDESQPGVAFQHFWLAPRGSIRGMAVMDMHGTHMEPGIPAKSLLLLDRSQVDVVPGNIYALAFGEDVVVKRLDRVPGKLLLLSDNANVPSQEVSWPSDDAHILARVLWVGRDMS